MINNWCKMEHAGITPMNSLSSPEHNSVQTFRRRPRSPLPLAPIKQIKFLREMATKKSRAVPSSLRVLTSLALVLHALYRTLLRFDQTPGNAMERVKRGERMGNLPFIRNFPPHLLNILLPSRLSAVDANMEALFA